MYDEIVHVELDKNNPLRCEKGKFSGLEKVFKLKNSRTDVLSMSAYTTYSAAEKVLKEITGNG